MSRSTTSLKLPADLKEKVAAAADSVAQTPHAYMVDAIASRVARDEKRKAFLDSAAESEREVLETGVAYDFDDVKRYILGRAAGRKVARPKPRKIIGHKR